MTMKFNLKQNLLTLTMLSCAAGLIGCSSTANSTSNAEPNKPTANSEKTTGEKTDKPAPNTNRDTGEVAGANKDKIGVPECDSYIEKYEVCLTGKVPEAARQQLKTSFEMTRKSWKDLAANPNTKSTLASACKQSEAAAKQAMTAYQCDFN